MDTKLKLSLIIVLVALFGGLGVFMFDNPFAEAQELNEMQKNVPEIDQNQSDDQIGKTIIVKLHDGVSSGDELK